MRWLLALLVLAGCADRGLERMEDVQTKAHWCAPERPVTVVISDKLPATCAAAVCDGVAFWEDQGVDYILGCSTIPDDQLTPDVPMLRFISVTANMPEDIDASGDTRIHRIIDDCIDAAEIRFDPYWCGRGNTEEHELGHALGLSHSNDRHNLMYEANRPGGYDLTAAQLEQVR